MRFGHLGQQRLRLKDIEAMCCDRAHNVPNIDTGHPIY